MMVGGKSMQIKTDNDRIFYDHSSGIPTFCLTQTKFTNTVGGCQTELIAKSRAKVFGFCTHGVLFRSPLC